MSTRRQTAPFELTVRLGPATSCYRQDVIFNAVAGEGLEAAPSEPWPASGIELAIWSKAEGTTMVRNLTLLDLVNAVAEHARSEAEVIATIVWMVNGGHVRLCGTFKGARFDLTTLTA